MCKLSCLLLLLITIASCSTNDGAINADAETSRNDRDHEIRKPRADAKSIEYEEDDSRSVEEGGPPYEDDASRDDSEEFRGGKLIGKWRNNGAAFEPKWRDGDSLPLVPFNAAKQTKVGRHDDIERSAYRGSSHGVTKSFARDASIGRIPKEGSVEAINPVSEDYPLVDDSKNDRHSSETRYRDGYDDSQSVVSELPSRSIKKTRASAVLTDDLRYETAVDEDISGKASTDDGKIETSSSRSRYRDTFQVNPNEYELNDEEYQKPRPRKRRPPQNYEFSETRAPTYSITWSTERYIETTQTPDRPNWTKVTEPTRRRSEKPVRRNRNRTSSTETRRISENTELKSLLKMQQIEGLSLSELLQRRNLTLNDLLKNKADVINALKASDSNDENVAEFSTLKPKIPETKKVFTTTEATKWRPSESRVKNIDTGNEVSTAPKSENDVPAEGPSNNKPEDEESMEQLDSAETEDGQRKSNDNEKLSAIVRLTKPIILPRSSYYTEKSIVGTTGSIAKESVEGYENDRRVLKNEKPKIIDDDEIMEFSDFTVKKNVEATSLGPEITTMRNINLRFDETYEDSGSTLSIENILGTTEQTIAVFPATTQEPDSFDNKVNYVGMELTNYTDILDINSEYQSDEPQHFADERSGDELLMGDQPYEDPVSDSTDKSPREEETWRNHQIFSTSSKPYEVVVSEIEPEARAEISELFSSGSSAKRLELLLKSRNMSIDELIALRQRGSSKVHMAEVLRSREALASRSHNQYVNSEAVEFRKRGDSETTEESLPATTIDDLSDVEIETTSTEVPVSVSTEDHTNIASIGTARTISAFTTEQTNVLPMEVERTESSTMERKIVKHVQLIELLTAFDSLPFSIRPDLDQENSEATAIPNETRDRTVPEDFVEKTKNLSTSLVEVGLVEEIVNEEGSIPFDDSSDMNLLTNNSSTPEGEDRRNLSKVRPSIIASGAILGVTIVVFLAIFIVCRIRQKQKYTYRNTFSRAVFQGPNMTARKLSNSSSLNTIMVNVVATSTTKRPDRHEQQAIDDEFDFKSDIENDSLDANDSWDTIPDFMK